MPERAPLVVEVWSDVVCPFCWIGKRHLEQAIDQAGLRGEVVVVDRAFQLDPAQRESVPLREHLARKFGGAERARIMQEHVSKMGAGAGLAFEWDRAVAAPTLDAHRLVRLARAQDKGNAMMERLMRAHFTEGADLADHATLRVLARDVGLDAGEVEATLASDRFVDEVQAEAAEAFALGARGVPFFVLDRRLGVAGAQPVEALVEALRQARGARPPEA